MNRRGVFESVAHGVARFGLLILILFAGAVTCWADSFKCGALPTDQDPGDLAEQSSDICTKISFYVPEPNSFYSQKKSTANGWGWIVLTFDRPIDGASFVFNPDCPTPLDGVLTADMKTVRLGPGSYGIGATGAPASLTAGQNNQTLDVTIMYDIEGGVPNIVFKDGDGNVSSFWKAKPETGAASGFTFSPADGRARNFDVALDSNSIASEPPSLLSLSSGFIALFAIGFIKRDKFNSRN